MTPTAAALAATFERLRGCDELCRADIDVQGDDDWLHLGGLLGRGLDELFGAVDRAGPRRRDYAGAAVAAALVDALVGTAVPPLLVDRRLPDVSPANVSVLLHDSELWFAGISLHEPRCWLLGGDEAAADPSASVVADVDALHHVLAELLVSAVAPWFDAIRARAPFGRRGMWGQLADDVCGTALWTARATGVDAWDAWREANAVLDLVADVAGEPRVRPRPFPVRWGRAESLWQVKGTCCLWYTTTDGRSEADAYCTTCPLRGDEERHERLRAWLETNAVAADGHRPITSEDT